MYAASKFRKGEIRSFGRKATQRATKLWPRLPKPLRGSRAFFALRLYFTDPGHMEKISIANGGYTRYGVMHSWSI